MSAVCGACGTANDALARACSGCGVALTAEDPDTATLSLDIINAAAAEVAVDRAQFPPETGLLIITRGPKGGSRYALDGSVITAGRDTRSDIFLDDVTVSRHHCRFSLEDGTLSVEDSGSTNGTYVNDSRVDSAELRAGDEVLVGRFHFLVVHGDA